VAFSDFIPQRGLPPAWRDRSCLVSDGADNRALRLRHMAMSTWFKNQNHSAPKQRLKRRGQVVGGRADQAKPSTSRDGWRQHLRLHARLNAAHPECREYPRTIQGKGPANQNAPIRENAQTRNRAAPVDPRRSCVEAAPIRAVSGVAVPLSRFASRKLLRHPLQVAMGYPSGRCHQGCLRGFLKIGHRWEP
jgi:hypothetical protein